MPINKNLTPEQYRVMFHNGTEQKYSGGYYKTFEIGQYQCLNCSTIIANSTEKITTDIGWASFKKLIKKTVTEKQNVERGYIERFLYCTKCTAHIGHIHTQKDGTYYLLNSNALKFIAD